MLNFQQKIINGENTMTIEIPKGVEKVIVITDENTIVKQEVTHKP